ncbi:TetR/AcrR family transcriptional regulator [Tenggerimyces flavus]|uniref:TetR/AcrR family transcriptional regulator n=1 Tax=Tenggerimyces flavus TaxID=1708749 RepID=A0ABV7YEH5_9ACTN|nr:TetR/AcrR family transcriptional regulator [Tenggerimyces flavus]MBM7787933.1 AcrR family transcriptional regulator [Tenggerimyces flavus]
MTTQQLLRTGDPYRQRLLDGLGESIAEIGYRNTTVADVVRRARTSRRTFYEHFGSLGECLIALLNEANVAMIRGIEAAVSPDAPWHVQVRQAIEAWIEHAESAPWIVVSWIRDIPTLGIPARALQREMMDAFVRMVQVLTATDAWRAIRPDGVDRGLALILLGGLRELIATTVEEGGRPADILDVSVQAAIALLGPPPAPRP